MITTAGIDYLTQISAFFAGAAPTNGGRASFPASQSGSLSAPADTFCYEIRFADLVLEGGNYLFRLVTDDEDRFTINEGALGVNLAGDIITVFHITEFFYLETNAAATISGLFTPLPPTIDANGVILIKSVMTGNPPDGAGDYVFILSWPASAINALGQSKFYAKLVMSAFNG